jgi:hypothetical protein
VGTLKQFCAHGHDTFATGRYSNGYCKACKRDTNYVRRDRTGAKHCVRGHDYATYGRDTAMRCRECKRINGLFLYGPFIPIAPLQGYLRRLELPIDSFPSAEQRRLHRWFSAGQARLYALDEFIVSAFKRHPCEIYGEVWFTYDEGLPDE